MKRSDDIEQYIFSFVCLHAFQELICFVILHPVLVIKKDPSDLLQNHFLYQNYPNPFNPSTDIRFDLPEATRISIKVYDMLGKEITTLKDENINAGYHSVIFNAKNLASGLYMYKIVTDKHTQVRKMSLLK
jgi:hypothetical protein